MNIYINPYASTRQKGEERKTMKKETYKLQVRCKNCGEKQVLDIPIGKRFTRGSYSNGRFSRIGGTNEGYFYDEQADCRNCGCAELNVTIKL